jgi:hypothetical protein
MYDGNRIFDLKLWVLFYPIFEGPNAEENMKSKKV